MALTMQFSWSLNTLPYCSCPCMIHEHLNHRLWAVGRDLDAYHERNLNPSRSSLNSGPFPSCLCFQDLKEPPCQLFRNLMDNVESGEMSTPTCPWLNECSMVLDNAVALSSLTSNLYLHLLTRSSQVFRTSLAVYPCLAGRFRSARRASFSAGSHSLKFISHLPEWN